jgi:hypothetical protein
VPGAWENSKVGKTANGVTIVPGLRVWNNDLDRGTVTDKPPKVEIDGVPWFEVIVDGKERGHWFDGWRMTTVHPFTHERA